MTRRFALRFGSVLMFAMVAFLLFSTAKAYNDRDVCAGGPKHWNVLPPEWRCEPPPFVTP